MELKGKILDMLDPNIFMFIVVSCVHVFHLDLECNESEKERKTGIRPKQKTVYSNFIIHLNFSFGMRTKVSSVLFRILLTLLLYFRAFLI